MNDSKVREQADAFVKRFMARLEKGSAEYGNQSFAADPRQIRAEILEELEDYAVWSFVLWVRVRSGLASLPVEPRWATYEELARRAAERADAENEDDWWESVDDRADLNVWTDEDDRLLWRWAVFCVHDGKTNTQGTAWTLDEKPAEGSFRLA